MVESLLSVDVLAVACGNEHVVVVGGKGDVYAWGRGAGGRLGLGHEDDCCTPQQVKIDTEEVYVVNCKASGNGTILLTDGGQLYASGYNRYNRLGLHETKGLFMTSRVDKVLVPTRVKSVKHPIVDLAMGPNHTACLTDAGKLITFGRNSEAQLGRGHARSVVGPDFVKLMQDREVNVVSCGATFTIVGSNENVIYLWGTRFMSPIARPSTRDAFNQSFGARLASPADQPLTEAEVRAMVQREMDRGDDGRYGLVINSDATNIKMDGKSLATLSSTELLTHQGEITMKDVVLEPREILALYASPKQLEKGETVMIGDIQSQNQNIFLVAETTCPLSTDDRPATAVSSSASQRHHQEEAPPVLDMNDYDADDDNRRAAATAAEEEVPPWLQNELEDAKDGFDRPQTRDGVVPKQQQQHLHRRDHSAAAAAAKALNRNTQDYKRKLEKEFNKKQIEIRMEAQHAVREREKALNDEVSRLRDELDRQKRSQTENMDAKVKESDGKSGEGHCVVQ